MMTKKNLPTNSKETKKSNWTSRAGRPIYTSVKTFKHLTPTKTSTFRIFPKKKGLPTKIPKVGTIPPQRRTDLYKQEALRQLADTKLYAKGYKDLILAIQKAVKDTVNKLIWEEKLPSAARNLFVTTFKTSTFYLKPKIHKPN